jgi:hypothetical protein
MTGNLFELASRAKTRLLSSKIVEREGGDSRYSGNIMFVNLTTDRGALQFVAYNIHNGYYGHEATVTCKQLTYSAHL